MRPGTLFLIGAIVLAAATAYFFYDFLQQQSKPKVIPERAVVMARVAIPARQAITADMLMTVRFPVKLVLVTNSVAEIKDVVGKWTVTAVKPLEIIRSSDITEKNKLPGLSPIIPQGMRAITIGISDTKGVAGAIFPGDHVDIIANVKDPRRNEAVVQVPLQNLLVIAVDKNITEPTVGANSSLTLCTTTDEAQLITVAEESGAIRVMLRSRDDDKVFDNTGITPDAFLKSRRAQDEPKPTVATPAPLPPPKPSPQPEAAPPKPPTIKKTIIIGSNSKEYELKPPKEDEPRK